jgi:Scavenger receptor cysteine-rich domain
MEMRFLFDLAGWLCIRFEFDFVCIWFSNLATAVIGNSNLFGVVPDTLIVWWRAVQCDGNEANIAFCPFQLNNNRCTHQQDAGVYCLGSAAASTSIPIPLQLFSTSTLPPKTCKTTFRVACSQNHIRGTSISSACICNGDSRSEIQNNWYLDPGAFED